MTDKDKKDLEKMLNAIYESQYRLYAINLQLMRLIQDKLDNVYGIKLDLNALLAEAEKTAFECWDEIKKTIKGRISFKKTEQGYFDDKRN